MNLSCSRFVGDASCWKPSFTSAYFEMSFLYSFLKSWHLRTNIQLKVMESRLYFHKNLQGIWLKCVDWVSWFTFCLETPRAPPEWAEQSYLKGRCLSFPLAAIILMTLSRIGWRRLQKWKLSLNLLHTSTYIQQLMDFITIFVPKSLFEA